MNRVSIALSSAALLVASLVSQGVANPGQNSSRTAYLVWILASRIGWAAALYAQGHDQQQVDKFLAEPRQAAAELGTQIPPFPSRSDSGIPDRAAMLNYLTGDDGGCAFLARWISHRYPKDDKVYQALFELGIKLGVVTLQAYTPNGGMGESMANVVADRAKKAGLPENIWSPAVQKLKENAPREDVKAATAKMYEDIDKYLSQGLSLKPSQLD